MLKPPQSPKEYPVKPSLPPSSLPPSPLLPHPYPLYPSVIFPLVSHYRTIRPSTLTQTLLAGSTTWNLLYVPGSSLSHVRFPSAARLWSITGSHQCCGCGEYHFFPINYSDPDSGPRPMAPVRGPPGRLGPGLQGRVLPFHPSPFGPSSWPKPSGQRLGPQGVPRSDPSFGQGVGGGGLRVQVSSSGGGLQSGLGAPREGWGGGRESPQKENLASSLHIGHKQGGHVCRWRRQMGNPSKISF